MLAAYLTAPVPARHDDSVDRREYQEALRHEARRQHHVVDVLVIEPGAHLSVLGRQPERLDLRAHGRVLRKLLEPRACPGSSGGARRPAPGILLHEADRREADREAELPERQAMIGGRPSRGRSALLTAPTSRSRSPTTPRRATTGRARRRWSEAAGAGGWEEWIATRASRRACLPSPGIEYVRGERYDTYMGKLTLSVNKEVVAQAKRYAARRPTSVSR